MSIVKGMGRRTLLLLSLGMTLPAAAQRLCVVDGAGQPVAAVLRPAEAAATVSGLSTDAAGCVAVPAGAPGPFSLIAPGFAPMQVTLAQVRAGQPVVLTPQVAESVTVTADRGLPGISDSASSVALLTRGELDAEPGLTLDDRLHQVAGFALFRRTSSWTANPTTEGVSLRGLGSTAASRTLVVSDQVPLNDPFGGWIHWDEVPALAVRAVSWYAAVRPTCTARARSGA